MTREEAIKILENEKKCVKRAEYCDRQCGKCELVKEDKIILKTFDMAIEALKQEPRWVSVGERLPKDEDYYLVTDDAGGMKTVEISFFVPDCEAPWDYVNVTAWMSLPSTYKGDERKKVRNNGKDRSDLSIS